MSEKVIIPIPKKKRGALSGNRNQSYPAELRATQFAQEEMAKDIAALKKQCDALAKLDKEKDIIINALMNQLKRLENRVNRSDADEA